MKVVERIDLAPTQQAAATEPQTLPATTSQSSDFVRPQPGTAATDTHDHASRVRLWALSAGGKEFTRYADEDLWCVPEVDDRGRHCYYSRRMGTFTYTFSP